MDIQVKSFSDHMMENLCCDNKDRDLRNVSLADKIKVKDFIKSYYTGDDKIFDHILWTGYDVKEAMKNLTVPCVIKPNNAWHRIKFIRSQKDINSKLEAELYSWLTDIRPSWEWYYKQIKPGFVIEKLMPDIHTMHRVYVFGGTAKLFFNQHFDVSKNSLHNVPDNTFYYAETGELIPVSWDGTKYKHRDFDWKKLSEYSEKLAQFPEGPPAFVRVDFYLVDGQPYFSEMTMLPDAASRHRFSPDDLDYEMGRWYRECL